MALQLQQLHHAQVLLVDGAMEQQVDARFNKLVGRSCCPQDASQLLIAGCRFAQDAMRLFHDQKEQQEVLTCIP